MEFILVLLLGYFKSQIGLKRKGSLQGAAQGSIRVSVYYPKGSGYYYVGDFPKSYYHQCSITIETIPLHSTIKVLKILWVKGFSTGYLTGIYRVFKSMSLFQVQGSANGIC